MKRALLAFVVSIGLVVGVAIPAGAHYYKNNGYTLYTGADCVWSSSETSHGSVGGGYYRGKVRSDMNSGDSACAVRFPRPAGNLALLMDGFRWNGSEWQLCWGTGWMYSSGYSSSMDVPINHPHRTPTCGDGYYGLNTHGYVYNGGWKGGVLWSGYHYLPA